MKLPKYVLLFLAIVAAGLVSTGCQPRIDPAFADFDPRYVQAAPSERTVSFGVVFVDYGVEEQDLIDTAWALAEEIKGPQAALWKSNAMRIAVASARDAREIKEIVSACQTAKLTRQDVIMPPGQPFELIFGPIVKETGLAYTTRDETTYADVRNYQMILRIKTLGAGAYSSVVVSPLFSCGVVPEDVELKGMEAVFPLKEDALFLIAPEANPAELRPGALLIEETGAGRVVNMVLVEMRLL